MAAPQHRLFQDSIQNEEHTLTRTEGYSINRRRFLGLLAKTGSTALAASSAFSQSAIAAIPLHEDKSLKLVNLHTNERLDITYFRQGKYDAAALYDINQLMRDHRAGEATEMSLELIESLSLLQACCGTNKEIHLISGYRSPKTNEALRKQGNGVAKRSFHMTGQAVDIRVPGIALSELKSTAKKLKVGGVGYYPNSGFIHMDVGRVRYWS